MKIRRANEKDCEFIFEWIQSPEVRAAGFSDDKIEWEEHKQWFQNRLADEETAMYMAELNSFQNPIGHVRFEVENSIPECSVILNQLFRGKGLGTELIRDGTKIYTQNHPHIHCIEAVIKKDNIPSQKAFQKAGYIHREDKTINREEAVIYKFIPNK